jgi:hypothetical protein
LLFVKGVYTWWFQWDDSQLTKCKEEKRLRIGLNLLEISQTQPQI